MNNSNANGIIDSSRVVSSNISTDTVLLVEIYIYVSKLLTLSGLILLSYTTVLNISREIKYIWFKRFHISSVLYLFIRYGGLASQGFITWMTFQPLEKFCNVLAYWEGIMAFLMDVGIQGVLIIPALSMFQGNKIIAVALISGFLSGLILELYFLIAFGKCIETSRTLLPFAK